VLQRAGVAENRRRKQVKTSPRNCPVERPMACRPGR